MAFRAISFRFAGESACLRAGPPLSPPSRPRATAAGFFSEEVFSSVAMSMMNLASWLMSDGGENFFLLVMRPLYQTAQVFGMGRPRK